MKKRKTRKNQEDRTSGIGDTRRFTLSRRQFSLGVSGIVLAGTGGELLEHNTLSAHVDSSPSFSTQSAFQAVTPHAFYQPQSILSETRGCVWSPDSRALATFQENSVTLYDVSTGKGILTYSKHRDEVLTMKWSGDGHYLASSAEPRDLFGFPLILASFRSRYDNDGKQMFTCCLPP